MIRWFLKRGMKIAGHGIVRHRLKLIIGLPLLMCLCLGVGEAMVMLAARGLVQHDLQQLNEAPVALVLGAARQTKQGTNLFYRARMDAAVCLYQAGKVRGILVSGDNSRRDYDEPSDMREDLIARGVPAEVITLDYAGFRTLDSVVRAKQVFGLDNVIIVSQAFHCERALFIARAEHLSAQGYAAADPPLKFGIKTRARETLARMGAVLDVWVLGRTPRFLGPQEHVALRAA